jgi:hypothetical protein
MYEFEHLFGLLLVGGGLKRFRIFVCLKRGLGLFDILEAGVLADFEGVTHR